MKSLPIQQAAARVSSVKKWAQLTRRVLTPQEFIKISSVLFYISTITNKYFLHCILFSISWLMLSFFQSSWAIIWKILQSTRQSQWVTIVFFSAFLGEPWTIKQRERDLHLHFLLAISSSSSSTTNIMGFTARLMPGGGFGEGSNSTFFSF